MDRNLRIALVVNPFSLTLKGRDHAPELARELLGRGHSVRGFGAAPGVIPRSSSEPSVAGGVAPDEGLGLIGFQPAVIVAYDALSPAAWLGARRARRLDANLLLVEEGFPAVGHPIERFLRWIGERLWGSYVRRTATRVVALDPVARAQLLREGFPEDRIVMLQGGVQLTIYRPGLTSRIPGLHGIRGRILLHMGPLEEGRGLETLIRAFGATVGQRSDWSLVLAGEGSGRVKLRALVDRLGIGARVHWIATPRDEELPGLLGASTLFAAPTLDDDVETLPIRRALACGTPVLGSEVPRLAGLVEPDGCGLLAAPGDEVAWTEMLQTAASSPVRRRRWRDRARELAEQRLSWQVIAEKFETIIYAAVEQTERNAAEEQGKRTLRES